MTTLTRWEPFRELTAMREMMDRFFDEPFFSAPRLWERASEGFFAPLDIIEEDDHYLVQVSIPGVDPNNVDVTLTNNVLTIKGETKTEKSENEKNYHVRERRWGSFSRTVTLPMGVDADNVEATHENGVLTLRLPKVESAKPKRIAISQTVNGARS
jgi:HSP20 family protein